MALRGACRRAGFRLLPLATALQLVACAKATPITSDPEPADLQAEQGFCVSAINQYRATLSLPPLNASQSVLSFSNDAARIDGEVHEVHHYFLETHGGGGVAHAENEIPWWNLNSWGSVHAVIDHGLSQQWAEGPGGLHYENMIAGYSDVACGISINNGEVTVTQDFH